MHHKKVPHKGKYTEKAAQNRLEWVRTKTELNVDSLSSRDIPAEQVQGTIESFIGTVEIPLGVTNPINIKGKHAKGEFVVPIATTAGALVAAINRGIKAVNNSGGVNTSFVAKKMMRSPVFTLKSMEDAISLRTWLMVDDRKNIFNRVIKEVSSHTRLVDLQCMLLGKKLYVNFVYETGDAAGQNMALACTNKLCKWITKALKEEINIAEYLIESNASGGKKVGYQNIILNKGTHVVADINIPNHVIQSTFKVKPDDFVEAFQTLKIGGSIAGMMGNTLNISSVLSGIFIATGQDPAVIHESSIGLLEITKEKNSVYCSLSLPSLVIGTVGGGTHLPHQQLALNIMRCAGKDKVKHFAEIICATALSLELSTLAAIVSNQLYDGQKRYGRNKVKVGIQKEGFNEDFFEAILSNASEDVSLKKFKKEPNQLQSFPYSTLNTFQEQEKNIGLWKYKIYYQDKQKNEDYFNLVVKSGVSSHDYWQQYLKLGENCNRQVSDLLADFREKLGYVKYAEREIQTYNFLKKDRRFGNIPSIYSYEINTEQDIYLAVLEDLSQTNYYRLINTIDNINQWNDSDICAVLKKMAKLHATFFNDRVLQEKDFFRKKNKIDNLNLTNLLDALVQYHHDTYPSMYTQNRAVLLKQMLGIYESILNHIEEAPKTLVHGAMNPSNIVISHSGEPVFFCWKNASIDVPQRDLAEFLLFTLPNASFLENQAKYYSKYVDFLQHELSTKMSIEVLRKFKMTYVACIQDMALERLNLLTMEHKTMKYNYLERVLKNSFQFLETIIKS
ncbi:MAG: hypothetical protein GY827_00040 [Cytophagales bacterium]|nr:hypothetical protein [Cytophagales bacterium]